MIYIEIQLEDQRVGWGITRIAIDKDGESFFLEGTLETFPDKDHAEQEAKTHARSFLKQRFGIGNGDFIWNVIPRSSPRPAD